MGDSSTAGKRLQSQSGWNNNRDGNYAYYVNLFYFDSAKLDDYDKNQTLSVRQKFRHPSLGYNAQGCDNRDIPLLVSQKNS